MPTASSRIGYCAHGRVTYAEDIKVSIRITAEQFRTHETAMRAIFHKTNFGNVRDGDLVEGNWTFSLDYLGGIEHRFRLLADMLDDLPPSAVTAMSMENIEGGKILLERMMTRFRALEARVHASRAKS